MNVIRFFLQLSFVVTIVNLGCTADQVVVPAELAADLPAVPSSLAPGEAYYADQPQRDHPYAVALSADGAKVYVTLRGDDSEPRSQVAVVDATSLRVQKRIAVGSSPNDIVLHPGGRYMVVANRFSAFLSIIDTESDEQVAKVPTPYYATEVAFNTAGDRAWITNRWLDSVLVYDVETVDPGGLNFVLRQVPGARLRDQLRSMWGVPVGTNPRGIAVDEASGRVFVANMPDLTISVIDIATEREIDTDKDASTTDRRAAPGVTRLWVGAPISDLIVMGGTLYVATFSKGTGHPSDEGPDTDRDGRPGDGTVNRGFHDLQNEIATYNTRTLDAGVRYTSDSIAGFFGDAPADDPNLPPVAERIVIGGIPERLAAVSATRLALVASGTGEVSFYDIAGSNLTPAGSAFVGLFPYGIAVDKASGAIYVANRLSEDVARVAGGAVKLGIVGDVSDGAFPASDAEIGELVMDMTSLFSADGDTSCEHCHRELGSQQRRIAGGVLASPLGLRSTPVSRNLLRTLPWMLENFLDELTFFPQLNRMAKTGNFGPGAPLEQYADRDAFMLAKAEQFVGRTRSFGDSLSERSLDFDGLSQLLGIGMLIEPRLLPNPNSSDTFAVERGKVIFFSTQTACAACHPEPQFALNEGQDTGGMPMQMRMLTNNFFEGTDTDELKESIMQQFGIISHRYGVPSLRGLWDRNEMFFHDGRAESLIEALATPDHPALAPGQRGFNVRDGVLDIHGGTSHLTAADMRDLIEYMLTIE